MYYCSNILTHPIASAMLCPSLLVERGEGRLRTSGGVIKNITLNCVYYLKGI